MSALFLVIATLSVAFFVVFLLECSRPARQSKRAPVVRKLSATEVDSATGHRFLAHLERQMAEFLSIQHRSATLLLVGIALISVPITAHGQRTQPPLPASSDTDQQISPAVQKQLDAMQRRIEQLEAALNSRNAAGQPSANVTNSLAPAHSIAEQASDSQAEAPQKISLSADDRSALNYLKGTTINFSLDGYYAYNFNNPVGRVNVLRAYDVLSNSFGLNQAAVIFERAPAVDEGRRFGARLDLQFGQATETVQGNPANEHRPDTYRNIFQAYGTYVVPLGSGLTVDFGKWASSLGIEGNYTQFQINYSRAYWFDYLPFYHMGIRAQYNVNKKLALNYSACQWDSTN